jgi:uncharacterized protein (DUF2252 family)
MYFYVPIKSVFTMFTDKTEQTTQQTTVQATQTKKPIVVKTQYASPSPSQKNTTTSKNTTQKTVKEQNQEIAEKAYQQYLNGEDYWSSVDENIQKLETNKVCWTPNGKSYHSTKDCVALLRSKDIRSGTLQTAFAKGKIDPCSKCVGD